MEFRILGPLEVLDDADPVTPAGPKLRAVLAVLLLHANEPVSGERLAIALWGEDAPAGAARVIQVHISRVRRALRQAGVLATTPGGYQLRVLPGELDADRFEQLTAEGHRALAGGAHERAADLLREALSLWRGPALADVAFDVFAQTETERLEEERLVALESRVEADLALGRHGELAGELAQLVGAHPLRERLRGQLMLALYRCGRQADALEVYRQGRRLLVDELGLEPGPELQQLEHDVLTHSAELAAPETTTLRRLPPSPNRTVGRGAELDELGQLLRAGSVRLLTLTGPGGVGKTRLALEAARAVEADFAHGAHFVSLAALQRPEDVPEAVVAALGIVVLSGETAVQAVERFLAAKHLLLVADNLEHLPAAAPFVGGLLAACPVVTVLATSREPLGLQAEQRFPVPPLALEVDAAALFADRARAVDPGFVLDTGNAEAVAEICRRVDGLPLAIELAAARCGLLSPDEIAQRLDAALDAPGARDAPARQQTLRATIDWSHDLLDEHERACFARFAVFAGGATVDAAEIVTGADLATLERLTGMSLLIRRREPSRLAMLETVRAYAGERFASAGDADAVRERHYRHYLALAQRHGPERVLRGAGASQHLARLDAEVNNLHAALDWAIGRADAERALTLVAALGTYWLMRDRYADAVDWVDRALELPGADAFPALHVSALRSKMRGLRETGRGDVSAVIAAMEGIARRHGDPVILSRVLQQRAARALDDERLDVADALADEALDLARAVGDEWEIAEASAVKAIAAPTVAELRERVDAAARLLTDAGNVHRLAALLTDATYGALCLGSERDAAEFAGRATPVVDATDSRYERMINSGNLALAELLSGETDDADDAFREELRLCRELVVRPVAFEGLRGLAAVAVVAGDDERAATLVGAAEAHRYQKIPDPVEARLDATFFEPARTRIGIDAWDDAVRSGRSLSFEDAIAYALEEP